jgi:protein FAM50
MAPSEPPSGTSTPRSFTNQTASTEDLLKSHTVGLVHLDDFRKRRAEVLEQKEKEAQDRTYRKFKASTSGLATPTGQDDSGG